MKAFGYSKKKITPEGLLEMSEVSFVASPAALRDIAKFLLNAADEIEHQEAKFGHAHFSHWSSSWHKSWPDVIVARSE